MWLQAISRVDEGGVCLYVFWIESVTSGPCFLRGQQVTELPDMEERKHSLTFASARMKKELQVGAHRCDVAMRDTGPCANCTVRWPRDGCRKRRLESCTCCQIRTATRWTTRT